MLQKISPAQPLFLVLLRHGDLKSGLFREFYGFENLPRDEAGREIQWCMKTTERLEIPAWEKLLACGRGGRGIQCGLIILLLRCLNKDMDGAGERIINCIPLSSSYVRYRTDWISAEYIVTLHGGRGVGKLAGLVQRVVAASLTHTAEDVAN